MSERIDALIEKVIVKLSPDEQRALRERLDGLVDAESLKVDLDEIEPVPDDELPDFNASFTDFLIWDAVERFRSLPDAESRNEARAQMSDYAATLDELDTALTDAEFLEGQEPLGEPTISPEEFFANLDLKDLITRVRHANLECRAVLDESNALPPEQFHQFNERYDALLKEIWLLPTGSNNSSALQQSAPLDPVRRIFQEIIDLPESAQLDLFHLIAETPGYVKADGTTPLDTMNWLRDAIRDHKFIPVENTPKPDMYVMELSFRDSVNLRVSYRRDDLFKGLYEWAVMAAVVEDLRGSDRALVLLSRIKVEPSGRFISWRYLVPEDTVDGFDDLPPEEQQVWEMGNAARIFFNGEKWPHLKRTAETVRVSGLEIEGYLWDNLGSILMTALTNACEAAVIHAVAGRMIPEENMRRLAIWMPGFITPQGKGGKRTEKSIEDTMLPGEVDKFIFEYEKRIKPVFDEITNSKPGDDLYMLGLKGGRGGKAQAVPAKVRQKLKAAEIDADLIDALLTNKPQHIALEQAARRAMAGYRLSEKGASLEKAGESIRKLYNKWKEAKWRTIAPSKH